VEEDHLLLLHLQEIPEVLAVLELVPVEMVELEIVHPHQTLQHLVKVIMVEITQDLYLV
tara:strand:- start:233 stop:409 length:177 start_codon:yes stop_codon:yes gene_type:complete